MNVPNNSVFYFYKRTDNSSVLECEVILIPLHSQHSVGYTFILTEYRDGRKDEAKLENVTSDIQKAEKFFDHICLNRIIPCQLGNAAKQILSTW